MKIIVSIIIPTYNRSRTIKRAIESVIQQSMPDWELIIVDDGSTDSTKEVAKSFLSDNRLRYFKINHRGVCYARNFGIKKARGQYIALLDSDDEFTYNKVDKQLKAMRRHKACLSLSNKVIFVNNKLKSIQNKSSRFFSRAELINNKVGISASLIIFSKLALKNVYFDENLPSANDFDFLLRAMKECKAFYVAEAKTVIHKSINYSRISTDLDKRIRGLKMVLQNNQNQVYALSIENQKKLSLDIAFTLAKFCLTSSPAIDCRNYSLWFLKNNRRLRDVRNFYAYIIYILTYIPFYNVIAKNILTINWQIRHKLSI